jgi:hypothetical protein
VFTVWCVNLVYLFYFFTKVLKKKEMVTKKHSEDVKTVEKVNPFKSKFQFLKLVCQEICIFMILSVILLFSLTDKTDFKESSSYAFLETLIIFSILMATLSELCWVITESFLQILRSKTSKVKAKKKLYLLNAAEFELETVQN